MNGDKLITEKLSTRADGTAVAVARLGDEDDEEETRLDRQRG